MARTRFIRRAQAARIPLRGLRRERASRVGQITGEATKLATGERCQTMGSCAYESNVRPWRGDWKKNHSGNSHMASSGCTVWHLTLLFFHFACPGSGHSGLGNISCWRAGVDGKSQTRRMRASEVIASSSCNVSRPPPDAHSHPLPSPPAPPDSHPPHKRGTKHPPFHRVLSCPLPSPSAKAKAKQTGTKQTVNGSLCC